MLALLERVEEIGEALPFPGQALDHDDLGNVLDAFHRADQQAAILLAAWREADPAIADHHRRHAMRRGRIQPVGPDRLAVIMGVDVDEAGGDDLAGRIDLLIGGAVDRADRGDPIALDGEVALVRLSTAAVDDRAVANDHIIMGGHRLSPRWN